MTRDAFEQEYATNSGTTVAALRALGRIVRPCRCGEANCRGWQSVNRELAEDNDRTMPDWDGAEDPVRANGD
jgi:hypothetical protein